MYLYSVQMFAGKRGMQALLPMVSEHQRVHQHSSRVRVLFDDRHRSDGGDDV